MLEKMKKNLEDYFVLFLFFCIKHPFCILAWEKFCISTAPFMYGTVKVLKFLPYQNYSGFTSGYDFLQTSNFFCWILLSTIILSFAFHKHLKLLDSVSELVFAVFGLHLLVRLLYECMCMWCERTLNSF